MCIHKVLLLALVAQINLMLINYYDLYFLAGASIQAYGSHGGGQST